MDIAILKTRPALFIIVLTPAAILTNITAGVIYFNKLNLEYNYTKKYN